MSECHHVHTFGQEAVRPGERRTWIVIGLTIVTMLVEITAGLVYGSMDLLADGLHMGSHATALGIAAFAYVYARRYAHGGAGLRYIWFTSAGTAPSNHGCCSGQRNGTDRGIDAY